MDEVANTKGHYPKLQDYPKHKKNDALWEDDVKKDESVLWWSFRYICREDLPKIRIRSPFNYTCGKCTLISQCI
jgi:hypothetical protein